MTRCLLTDGNLHNRFWGEAVHTANHLQNRLPSKGCKSTPYEIWNGRKPNLDYIRPFGCEAFVMIPKEQRRKLDAKAVKLTFVGYEEGSKAYRLLDETSNKIRISRDVYFLEDKPHKDCTLRGGVFTDKANEDTPETSKDIEVEIQNSIGDNNEEVREIPVAEQEIVRLRRSQRTNKGVPPERLIEVVDIACVEGRPEPKTRKEALEDENSRQWIAAMDEEIQAMEKNETWELTKLPADKNVIGSKWVYKIKTDDKGQVTRYKARLVAQGFSQKFGEDYDEVFAPVVKATTLRTLLTVAGKRKMTVRHYDIQTAFLNGDLKHEVYMRQPEGYSNGDKRTVCRLKKNIYGLKQGANEWNHKLNEALTENGFKRSKNDTCLYTKCVNNDWIYIVVHVDDVVGAASNDQLLDQFEEELNKTFHMKNLGELKYYLGIQFYRDQDGMFSLNQSSYIDRKLKEFNLQDSKPSKIPLNPGYQKHEENTDELESNEVYRKAIGSLLYLSTSSRPDIAVSTSILARRVEKPRQCDWVEVKRVFKYLKGTKDYKLKLGDIGKSETNQLICFVDADWGGDTTDRKSNSGYCFSFLGGTIEWKSKKQQTISLSSTEAEYISLAEASQEAMWITRLLKDFNETLSGPTVIYEDNQSCIKIVHNEKASQRTKHLDIKYHFVREPHRNR